MADVKINPQYSREIPLNGRLRTQEDPCAIGASDFQKLQNMRYTDTHIKGIGGMSKINTAAVGNTSIKSGIYFRKDQVAENFTLIQAFNATGGAPVIYSSTAAPPNTGSFAALYTQATAAGTARFSNAPGDKVAICDGKEALLYGGTEMKIAAYIDFDPNGTYRYDYSRQVTNSLADTDNLATVHRVASAIDANTMLLLHFDGTAQDSSPTTPHAIGNVGITYSSATAKFASAAYFNGSAYASATDNADFNFIEGVWTVDLWVYPTDLSTQKALYYQQTNTGNYINIKLGAGGGGPVYGDKTGVILSIYSASAQTVNINTANTVVPINAWSHITVVENGNDYRIFVNGSVAAYGTDTDRAANYTGNIQIGYGDTNYFTGYMDEFRVSNSARWTSDFTPPTSAYGTSSTTNILVGSTLPAKGIKFYVGTPNTGAGTPAVYYWNGTGWTSVSSLSDGTASGGIPLAQTGTMSFSNTASVAKLKAEDDLLLYWYKVEISNCDTTTTISQVTVDVACQTVKDIWDGEDRSIASFQRYTASAFNDFTTRVFEDNFDSSNEATWADIGNLPASASYLYCGFTERMQGVKFHIVGASGNSAANVMTCEYFNGGDPDLNTSWTSVAINDQTSNNNASLNKTGLVTWQPPSLASEFKTFLTGVVSNKNLKPPGPNSGFIMSQIVYPLATQVILAGATENAISTVALYYYRFSFSAALDATTSLSYVAGIPAQEVFRGYKFPMHHANRLWLCNNIDSEPNAVIYSSVNTAQVFNGGDSTKIYLGNNEGLVAGASLYTRMGSDLHNMLVLCKTGETWVIYGDSPDNFTVYRISDNVGCVAPHTMATVSLGEGEIVGVPRNFAIWQSSHGIVLCDGVNITNISEDIGDRFNPRSSNAINSAYMNTGDGFYDPIMHEYHFLCAGAGSTTLNEEWVFDVRRKKWFQVVRANTLTCGFPVRDTNGNTYVYAGDNAGYVYRLENGNTMNGNGITQTYRIGDVALHKGTIMENTQIDWGVLVAKAKSNATGTISITHYADGSAVGTTIGTVDPTKTGYRIVNVPIYTTTRDYTFHSLEASMTTNDETIGFEPLFHGISYRVFRREA